MTRAELEEFRRIRIQHYRYGIGSVEDIPAYRAISDEAEAFVRGLDSPAEQTVMRMLYLRGMSVVAVVVDTGMSERSVSRLRKKALGRLK